LKANNHKQREQSSAHKNVEAEEKMLLRGSAFPFLEGLISASFVSGGFDVSHNVIDLPSHVLNQQWDGRGFFVFCFLFMFFPRREHIVF
jgi:hypothetical protein